MNGTMKNVLIFVSGAAIGSVVAWKVLYYKYEQQVQKEVASIREVFSKREALLIEDLDEAHTKISENNKNNSRRCINLPIKLIL